MIEKPKSKQNSAKDEKRDNTIQITNILELETTTRRLKDASDDHQDNFVLSTLIP